MPKQPKRIILINPEKHPGLVPGLRRLYLTTKLIWYAGDGRTQQQVEEIHTGVNKGLKEAQEFIVLAPAASGAGQTIADRVAQFLENKMFGMIGVNKAYTRPRFPRTRW